MATFTPRLALRKPAGPDLINVATDLNGNYDILDNAALISIANTFAAAQTFAPTAVNVIPVAINGPNGLTTHLFNVQLNGVDKFRLTSAGVVAAAATDAYFGAYANGVGAGVERLHLLTTAGVSMSIAVEGDAGNRNLNLKTFGSGGTFQWQTAASGTGMSFNPTTGPLNVLVGGIVSSTSGATKFQVDTTGAVIGLGTINKFGRGGLGGTGIAVSLSEDGTNTFVNPAGTPTDIDLILRPKGTTTGATRIQAAGGTNLVVASSVTNTVAITQSAWTNIFALYVNGWADYGLPWQVGRFIKDSMGFVHLEGLINNLGNPTGAPLIIFTLPVGFRPVHDQLFTVLAFGGYCRVDINATTGDVTLAGYTGGNGQFVQLFGITFSTF